MSDQEALPGHAIAVVGMALRVPGARTLEGFWQNLCDGVESIRTFTDDELRAAGVPEDELAHPDYVPRFGALDDVSGFDARLFGFTPREAQLLDPQHRVFLECVWEALEHAGHLSDDTDDLVGVYGGVGYSSYYVQNVLPDKDLLARVGTMAATLGNDKDFGSTRVSYKLDLNGPSVSVQTACSTSLVAVHMACQALASGDCDLAVAGGARILLPAQRGYLFEPGGITAPDGHLRAFDAGAAGSVPGNGAGVVALKRLSDALADRDVIHAVIRGSAINNDGARKVGFTAPSVAGQAGVIAEALGVAEVDPASVTYVETHGTGTVLGDTIELSALTSVFGERPDKCALGSVKTNIGHLDAAAGVVGLIKAVLALRFRELPPSLHFTEAPPHAGMADGPFTVTTELTSWQADTRRAGVSSFGIGGTNAHVVLEEAPVPAPPVTTDRPQVLPLSAATGTALDAASVRLAAHLRAHPELSLADVAHTLQRGRRTLRHRRCVLARTAEEAIEALDRPAPERDGDAGRGRDVVFLFPGQGTQRIGMGRALYEHEPVFRAEVDSASALLDFDLREVLFHEGDARIDQTEYAQPALFVVEYALAQLWRSWGVRPAAMLGHSIGELVAACLAGVLTLPDALTLVAARGRLMQRAPGGVMVAVKRPAAEVVALLDGVDVDLAAENGPVRCVVSGSADAIREAEERLAAQGIQTRRMATSHAFHSRLMDEAAAAFETEVARVRLAAPRIPFVSNVTGTWITDAEATSPAYWARQLRSAVRFDAGMRTVCTSGGVLLEVGPGYVLTSLVRAAVTDQTVITSLPSATGDAHADVLTAMGELWCQGVSVEWAGLHGDSAPRGVVLPAYPFEHERYWIDPPADASPRGDGGLAVRGYRRIGPVVPVAQPDGVWLVVGELAGLADWLPVRTAAVEPDPVRLLDSGDRVQGVVVAADTPREWLLGLEEALAQRGDARIVAVVSGALDVTGTEELCPSRAALAAWAEERPTTRTLLDVAGPLPARLIAAELRGRLDDPVVALRGGHRFVPSLEPLRATASAGRHEGATYTLLGHPDLTAAVGKALVEAGAVVSDGPPDLTVVVLDAADPNLDLGTPAGAARGCEVHVILGADTPAGADAVLAARVSALQRASAVSWTTCTWTGADPARIGEHAAEVVGLAPGSCHLLFTVDDGEDLAVPAEQRHDDVEAAVARIFADLLGVAVPSPAAGFFELGGDSLLAVKLLADLRQACGAAPAMRALVAEPTVRGIARAVREAQAHSGDEALPAVVPDPGHAGEPFPLTELQQAFWVGRTGVFDIGDVGMHLYEEFDVPGLDVARLQHALRRLIDHHAMLRMVVLPHGEQQILAEVPDYVVVTDDLRDRSGSEAQAALHRTRAAMSHQVFDPACWPLFDFRATLLPGGQARMHVSIDGLVTDAWAIRILKRDLHRLYEDPDAALPELELSFRDYVLAERRIEATELYRRAERYWRERVPTMALAPELPLACDPATIDVARFRKVSGTLPRDAWARVKAWAARRGITPTAALLTAYAEALGTWSKGPRFTLNLPAASRLPLHPQVEEIVGDFTSVTLLEVDAGGRGSFESRARAVRDQLVSDLDHRYFSGVRVQRALRQERGEMAAILPVVFTCVLNDEATEPRLGEVVYGISQTPQVWIDAQAYESDGALALDIDSVENLFPEGMVAEIHAASLRLLTWLAEDEAHWGLPMPSSVPAADLAAQTAYNHTAGPVPEGLLHQAFFVAAARQPHRPAVLTPSRTVTYGELASCARTVAARLGRVGVRPNELVAVAMRKGWEQCAAVLGILAAGAAYLPIDPDLPDERIRFLLDHGQVRAVLTQSRLAGEDRFGARRTVLAVDELPADPLDELDTRATPDDLAYVIFTSGSTGVPKGVMISHRGALNTIDDVNERFGVGPDDRVLALSSLSFDLSVYDVFGPLAVGGAVVMPDASAHRDPAAWLELLSGAGVTVWNSVPALMELLVEHLEVRGGDEAATALRLVMMSGDWIPVGLPGRIRKALGAAEIVSLGGATEASIWSILHPIGDVPPDWVSIPYGAPMRNQTFHVLDEALRPRPLWVPGELYIGGIGLAKGYLRDEAKTAASFLVHPETGERLYRTGDLGRFVAGGVIEFLGREDFQVKIQGNRIELGEIDAAILQHPEVRHAVVVVDGKRLVAFVGPRVPEDLEEFLAAKLPRYMVPVSYQDLAAVPLTANGKLDRQALVVAKPAADDLADQVGPRTPVEEIVAEVWTTMLGVGRVGAHDNFFTLGGDSLIAMRAVVHLRKALDVELPMQVIFERQTLAEVAGVVEDALLTQIEDMSDDDAQTSLSG